MLQLISYGVEDSALTVNPEITFFKSIYKKHTEFIICHYSKRLNTIKTSHKNNIKIEHNGDLLGNLYFEIEIPSLSMSNNTNTIQTKMNISNLYIEINGSNIVLYNSINNTWYILDNTIYNTLYRFTKNITIPSNIFQKYFLPNLIPLNKIDNVLYILPLQSSNNIISNLINKCNITESSIINNIILNKTYYNKILSVITKKNIIYRLYKIIKNIIYIKYANIYTPLFDFNYYDFSILNTSTGIYTTEIEYFINNLFLSSTNIDNFDINKTYNYCIENNLDFNLYKYNTFNNSVSILFILSLFYSSVDLVYTFWKKYYIDTSNIINTNIKVLDDYNFKNEWKVNFDKYINIYNLDYNNIIINYFKKIYLDTSQRISDLMNSLNLSNPTNIYIKLKKIFDRFYSIPYYQLNFNNNFLITTYDLKNYYNVYASDTYTSIIYQEDINHYRKLINNFENLSSNPINNLTPVNMQYIYTVIAYEFIEKLIEENIPEHIISFLILWRNCVMLRVYKCFNDIYPLVKNNSQLFEYSNNRKTTLYYSIFPSNMFLYNDFLDSFYEMFYKNSFCAVTTNNTLIRFLNSNVQTIKQYNINPSLFGSYINEFESINSTEFCNINIINSYYLSENNSTITNNIILYTYGNYIDNNCSTIITTTKNVKLDHTMSYSYNTDIKSMILKFEFSNNITSNMLPLLLKISYLSKIPILNFNNVNNINYKKSEHKLNILLPYKLLLDNILSPNTIKFLTFKNESDINDYKSFYINVNNVYNADKYYSYDLDYDITSNEMSCLELDINTNILSSNNYYTEGSKIYISNNIDIFNYYFYYVNKNNKQENYILSVSKYYTVFKLYPIVVHSKDIYTYIYKFSYYNTNTNTESKMSEAYVIRTTEKISDISITFTNLNIHQNDITIDYNSINIYRSKNNSIDIYLLANINIDTSIYIDSKNDENLYHTANILVVNSFHYFDISSISYYVYTYNYIITRLDVNLNKEISLTNLTVTTQYTIGGLINNNIMLKYFNKEDDIKIYRTKTNGSTYYLLNKVYINDIYYIDNISDNNLLDEISNDIDYNSTIQTTFYATINSNEFTSNITYKYKISYYNNITKYETDCSDEYIIKLINKPNYLYLYDFTSIYNINNYTNLIIYRTNINNNIFYRIKILDIADNIYFTDTLEENTESISLTIFSTEQTVYNNYPIFKYLIEYNNIHIKYTYIFINVQTNNKTYVDVYSTNLIGNSYNYITVQLNNLLINTDIYRSCIYDNKYYFIRSITSNDTLSYIDNLSDNTLQYNSQLYDISNLNIDTNITYSIYNSYYYEYNYTVSFYNNINNNETILSSIFTLYTLNIIDNINTSNIYILHNISNDKLFNSIKIYKTNIFSDTYYTIYTSLLNSININNSIIDSINFNTLYTSLTKNKYDNIYLLLNNYNLLDSSNYYILQVSKNNIVPNIYNYISQSTISDCTNNKNLSDLNDYIFNKSFILFNDLQYNRCLLYLYNIPFKIIENSKILLNDIQVEYIIPLQSDQFFIKNDDTYYNITNKQYNIVEKYNIYQKYLNTSYNVVYDNINHSYYDIISKLTIFIQNNADYNNICNLITKTDNYYIDLFKNIFNSSLKDNLYGTTTTKILKCISENYANDIFKFYNIDFDKYSHCAQRLQMDVNLNLSIDNINYINISNTESIKLLTPIYSYYNNSKKVIGNIVNYLKDIPIYFNNYLKYITDNNSYLELLNYITYSNNIISYSTSNDLILNIFNTINTSNIKLTLLYPYIFNNIECLEYKSNYYNIIKNIDNTNLIVDQFYDNINNKTFNYYTKHTVNNFNKFTYIGIYSAINSYEFTNKNNIFILLDNHIIYECIYDDSNNNYYINTSIEHAISINTYILNIDNTIYNNYVFDYIGDHTKIYAIELFLSNTHLNLYNISICFTSNIIINGSIINNILYFETTYDLNIVIDNINNIKYKTHDNNLWIELKLDNYKILLHTNINYKCNTSISDDVYNSIIYCNNKYYYNNIIYKIFVIDKYVYYINYNILQSASNNTFSSTINITLYKYIKTLLPPIYIYNNIVKFYPLINKDLLLINFNYYIILVNKYKNIYILSTINNILNDNTLNDNYNCWIYKNETIPLINVSNVTTDKLPTNAFYFVNNMFIYHSEYNSLFSYNNIHLVDTTLYNTEILNIFNQYIYTDIDSSDNTINNLNNILYILECTSTLIKLYSYTNYDLLSLTSSKIIVSKTLYYLNKYPFYINSKIIIYRNTSNFNINMYYGYCIDNDNLNINQIIHVNDSIFLVLSNSSFIYDLQLINDKILLSEFFEGYYSYGIFTNDYNNINVQLPDIDYNSTLLYYKNKELCNSLYIKNNNLYISTTSLSLENIFTFTEPFITCTCKYKNNYIYSFDKLLLFHMFDFVIYDSKIYYIKSINYNCSTIQLYPSITNLVDNIEYSINLIIVYQPFVSKYIYVNNNKIINDNILNNTLAFIINENNENNLCNNIVDGFQLYNIHNNQIYDINNNNQILNGNMWIKYCSANNSLNLSSNSLFSNILPLLCSYDNNLNSIKIIDNSISILLYYNQCIYIDGVYNYINNIIDNNIYLKYNINTLNNQVYVYFSPYELTVKKYHSNNIFNYNNSLYYPISNNTILSKVIRYVVNKTIDKIVIIDNIDNFVYGTSYINSKVIDNQVYNYYYFYNYKYILSNTGTITPVNLNNTEPHLLIEKSDICNNIIYFVDIINTNKFKFYTNIEIKNITYYIDNIIPCTINIYNTFNTSDITIYQENLYSKQITDVVNIIYKYNIKVTSPPIMITENNKNMYIQKIDIDNTIENIISKLISKEINIFFDYKSTSLYTLITIDNYYYIKSTNIIEKLNNTIYLKYPNKIVYTTFNEITKKDNLNINDNILYNIIYKNIYDTYQFDIQLVNNTNVTSSNTYKYLLLGSSYNYFLEYDKYYIHNIYNSISNISNNILILTNNINNDTITFIENIYFKNVPFSYNNNITENDINYITYLVYNNIILSKEQLYYISKQYKPYSLLSALNTNIEDFYNLLYINVPVYLEWKNNNIIMNTSYLNDNVFFMTIEDYNILSKLLTTINISNNFKYNFINLKTVIEPAIYNILSNWLAVPYFYTNSQIIVNDYIQSIFPTAYFNGKVITFTDTIEYTNILESITYDIIYDENLNIIYRSKDTIINSINDINNLLINTTSEITNLNTSINTILEILCNIPNHIEELINRLSKLDNVIEIPSVINNLLLYILFEKYNNIFSSQIYNNINDIILNKNFNINNILYNLSQVYLYYNNITIESNIKLNNYTDYYVLSINDNQYTRTLLQNIVVNNKQLEFYSNININYNDFVIIELINKYNISSIITLGYIYTINITNIDCNKINNINCNTDTLKIILSTTNTITVLSKYILNNANQYDLIFNVSVQYYYYDDIKCITYIIFHTSINYIENITYIIINNIIYDLYYDNQNDIYYINKYIDVYNNIIYSATIIIKLIIDTQNIIFTNNIKFNIILDTELDENILSNYMLYATSLSLDSSTSLSLDSSTSLSLDSSTDLISNISIKIKSNKIVECDLSNDEYNKFINKTNNQIIFSHYLNHNIPNPIINIEKCTTDVEYLYYFRKIIPKTFNTYICLYKFIDLHNTNNIYDSCIINNSIQSIYYNQTIDTTYITLNCNIENLSDYGIIQKNIWNIDNIIIENNILYFDIPTDFTLYTSKEYKYIVNNNLIDNSNIILINNQLKILYNYTEQNITNIIFVQIYIELYDEIWISPYIPPKNNLLKLHYNNIKYEVTLQYPLIYNNNMYLSLINNSLGYIYSINTQNTQTTNIYYISKNINIIYLNKKYRSKILYTYYNQYLYILIILEIVLDPTNTILYYFDDNPKVYITNIQYVDLLPIPCTFYKYISTNKIQCFIKQSLLLDAYDNIKSIFYINTYKSYILNNSYNFKQSDTMKEISYSTNISNNININWNNIKYTKIFNYIRLYFNSQLVEEINEDIFNIHYSLYLTEEQKHQFDKVTLIRYKNNKYTLCIPLIFWFINKPHLFIPLVAIPYTDIYLEYKLNDLHVILDENITNMNSIDIMIKLNNDFIILNEDERKLYCKTYLDTIICTYSNYNVKYITNNIIQEHNLIYNIKGLIKDIYFISKVDNIISIYNTFSNNYNKSNYDIKYYTYLISKSYYEYYLKENKYYDTNYVNYIDNINIINIAYTEFINHISNKKISLRIINLIDVFSKTIYWDSNNIFLLYLLYYDKKFLSLTMSINKKNYLIYMYLKYEYKNISSKDEISPLDSLLISVDGIDLFSRLNWNYFNSVIPYQLFNQSLPNGYYVYSFSLNPLNDQPSGYLNFDQFDNMSINMHLNTTSNISFILLTKKYTIMRIMSGFGVLLYNE